MGDSKGSAVTKIVLSYRREDTKWIAPRIFERLVDHYGKGSVFIDIDSMPFGVDFREHIEETVRNCSALLAIIGPNWVGKDAAGASCISNQNDWVRLEIESALANNIPGVSSSHRPDSNAEA